MVEEFGFYGEGLAMSLLQQGVYPIPEQLDDCTKEFIDVCQSQGLHCPKNLMARSLQDYKPSWELMKEKTSSRQLHFGHFKASCTNELLTAVNYILAEIPFQSRYSPLGWKNATDVMILKKEGV